MQNSIRVFKLTILFSNFIFALNIAQADQKITFQQAIELTIQNNLELQASHESLKASEYKRKSATSSFLPNASASLSYDKARNESLGGTTTNSSTHSATLSLGHNLFNGFQDSANLAIADSKILNEEANLQDTKAQISFDLKNALANYFYAKDSLLLSRDIKKRREDNMRMVELRFESGRENKGSLLLSKAYLEQAKLDLTRAENALNISKTFLRRVLNLAEDNIFEITELPPALSAPSDPNFNLLIENTPTAKRFKAALATAVSNHQVSKSEFYPAWDLSASLAKTGEHFFPNSNKRLVAGTSLTWSFFDGGKDFYSTKSSTLLVKAAEKKLENENLEIRRILEETLAAFDESITSVKVSNAFLEAAKVRADISRSKYNNGLSTFEDWDLIENDLINRQRDYTLKIRDRLIAEAAWEKNQGTGVIP
ncbi:MAG: TolC family protein [Alphaproteobacteria bacterium]|nr:MAG: TolC family protein [Alphaproteobacteria bacterium]